MKGLIRALRRNPTVAPIVKTVVPIRNVAVSVAGTTGVGWGTAVIGDLPAGNILILGTTSYLQFATSDGDVLGTFAGNYAVGSVAATDTTITGARADVIPSTAIAAATAGLSTVTRGASAASAMLDNTDGSLELNLNLLINDSQISGTGDFTVNGNLHIAYIVLGDD